MAERELLNAHLSYKGKSIIADYERVLHCYSMYLDKQSGYVPVEVYPYKDDIDLFYVKLDERFHKADIGEIFEHTYALPNRCTVLCKSSVMRTPEEMLPMDYFIENNLIRDDSDGWSLKYQIYKDKC